jgi:hypothetical protein
MRLAIRLFSFGVMVAVLGILSGGCTTKSEARLEARDAYLAGQNSALRQAQTDSGSPGITIVGPVQNPKVPWIAGMTLLQALATANYLDSNNPKSIIITRDGESATLDPNVLFNGAVIPLEPGDVIELRR